MKVWCGTRIYKLETNPIILCSSEVTLKAIKQAVEILFISKISKLLWRLYQKFDFGNNDIH